MAHQGAHGAVGDAEFAALLAGDLGDQEAGQVRQVLDTLAQRRHADGHDVESVVEVLAELARPHLGLQVAVGGGDDAHVDLEGAAAADPLEFALLEHAQQLGLKGGADLADLVEEQGAAVGLLEAALAGADRAGEGALFVPEELGLEQVVGERGAVELDEGGAGAR